MFYPMFAMILLTTIVGLVAFRARYSAVKNKQVSIKYFQVMEGNDVPQSIKQSTRCFNNMFEIPILFYVIASLSMVLDHAGGILLSLAWLFVIFRSIHAYILLTYNNVIHRMLSYWAAFFSMLGMWVVQALQYA